MTKKFYIHDEISQIGPFDLEELKARAITKKTAIWFKGLLGWTSAGDISELSVLFDDPNSANFKMSSSYLAHDANQSSKRKNRSGLKLTFLLIGFLMSAFGFVVVNDPNAIPGMTFDSSSPQPKVISSSVDGTSSGLLDAQTTVDATVLNAGGAGKVLVTFYVRQGDNVFDKSKTLFIPSGETLDFESVFEELNYEEGKTTYSVEVKAE